MCSSGIGLVALFRWQVLDPIVALLVGVNILRTGYGLLRQSVVGLLDTVLPPEDVAKVHAVINRYRAREPVDFHALRTRESGRQRFVYIDLLVPGDWTVTRGHDLVERVAADIARELPGATTFTRLEPRSDPAPPHRPASVRDAGI